MPLPRRHRKAYEKHKELVRTRVHERISHFNTHYQVSIKRIAIKNHKSRWGSCSIKGNLNFSYRMAYLPEELFDYIIVHELCHLKEFNHSEAFWNLVGEKLPDHSLLRKKLRSIERE